MLDQPAIKTQSLGRVYKSRGKRRKQTELKERISVAGYDVATQSHSVRPLINMVSGGESSGYGMLTVRENLWMFGQFYGLDNKTTQKRIDELLDVVGLKDRADTKARTFPPACAKK